MDKIVADDVPTAEVLWMAAERIGKSSNGDEIQRIVDYLVNKHWFQTAGDLRTAQLATEEWHSLQIPSRLKIAVQHVLDEVQYFHVGSSSSQAYTGFQSTHMADYADYAAASHSDTTSGYDDSGAWTAADPTKAGAGAVSGYEAYDYSSYYYAHDPEAYVAHGGYTKQQHDYSTGVDASGSTASYAYDSTQGSNNLTPRQQQNEATDATSAETEAVDGQALADAYHQYYQEHHARNAYEDDVVEAQAVVVEDAATYEEILAPMPQEWSCRQCTFLNPIAASFCEMCQDHISASPDMAGRSFIGSAATSLHETTSIKPTSSTPSRAADVSAANARLASPALSPLYSPSAPSFDAMEYGDDTAAAVDAVYVTLSPSISADAAKHLAFNADPRSSTGAKYAIIHPTSVLSAQPLPPPAPQKNYLALAFSDKTTSSSIAGTAPLSDAASKTDDVREHEQTTRTSFSF